jgi:alkylation response protein AidB-like acyl-CoA dehydrogenase
VPKPHTGLRSFLEIVSLARALQAAPDDGASRAMLQARAAHLYRLDGSQFAHVLTTFPLVPRQARDAALSAFCGIVADW